MISSIVLNKEINCEYLCQQIQNLVNKYVADNGSTNNTVLVMQIKGIVDSQENHALLCIEHKQEPS